MWDIRIPAPEGLAGVALAGLGLYAAFMLAMLLLGELSALGQRMPRPQPAAPTQWPGLLAGALLAVLMIVALQAAQTGGLPPGASAALERAQRLLAMD